MAIPSMVRRISALSDRRGFRHDPLEGVRRHAKASRHAEAFDPRKLPQVRALAANDRDLRLANFLEAQHVLGLDHRYPPVIDSTFARTPCDTYVDHNTRMLTSPSRRFLASADEYTARSRACGKPPCAL